MKKKKGNILKIYARLVLYNVIFTQNIYETYTITIIEFL